MNNFNISDLSINNLILCSLKANHTYPYLYPHDYFYLIVSCPNNFQLNEYAECLALAGFMSGLELRKVCLQFE